MMLFNQLGLQGYSKAFWTANFVELLERAAYYGVFIVLTLYLSRVLGFSDVQAAWLSGAFSAGLYFLPTFTGALADNIGFRQALMLAFSLLSLGYLGLALLPTFLESAGLVQYGVRVAYTGLLESGYRWLIVPILMVIMIGGSFIKAVITGTVAQTTDSNNRAKGFAIFYLVVNIGAFTGKTIVKPLRESMGDSGLVTLNYFSASMTLLALLAIFFFFKSSAQVTAKSSVKEVLKSFRQVLANGRLMALILIVTGFWIVQHQLYATMPKYVLRMAGESASPSWYANVNPLVVVLTVGFVTRLMKGASAVASMTVGMLLMPLSALIMASGNLFDLHSWPAGWLHPIAMMMIIGIVFQGLAESFISPRYLEYFSLQAPKGEEGLYLGFSHLHSFLSSILGFGLSGYLLDTWCPDPRNFGTLEAWQAAAQNAHTIWFVFAGVALTSAIALLVFAWMTREEKASTENLSVENLKETAVPIE